jgi:hypothetical protein
VTVVVQLYDRVTMFSNLLEFIAHI